MKRICSFFSRLLSGFIKSRYAPMIETRIGFNIEDPFEGISKEIIHLEFDAIRKRNLQDHYEQRKF